MAVVAHPKDSSGKTLDANITNLTASLAATTGTVLKEHLARVLDQAQREAVLHYMMIGRITAATVLSTLA